MKCENCGNEFQGNFCPVCGTRSNGGETKEDGEKKADCKTPEVTKEIAKGGFFEYWEWCFKFIFLGAFLAAICMFAMGKILSGVMLAVGGILLSPPMLKKWIGKKRKILIGVAVLFIALGFIATKGSDRGKQVIEYVKQYRPLELSEPIGSIGEFMELGDLEIKWNYETRDGIEYVSAEYDEDGHHIKIIFKVHDYPELYDVLLDGESNSELYYEFDSRLFGNGDTVNLQDDGGSEKEDLMFGDISQSGEDNAIEAPVLKENSSVAENGNEKISGDVTLSEDMKQWFLDYDSFYHVRVGDELSVYAMNDALLFVSFSGVNGDSMEWELNLEPDDTGSEGEMIYYYGKDFSLSYYPSDHHIYIETSDDLYSGEYWPNE